MREYTKHHYIPQCYLKNFSIDGKGIYVYNKKNSKSYCTSIENIFFEKDFYSIDEELIPDYAKDRVRRESIEHDYFANQIESQFSRFLDIINSVSAKLMESKDILTAFPVEYTENIAFQIVIQYFRTPEARKYVVELVNYIRSVVETLIDCNAIIDDIEREQLKFDLTKPGNEVLDHCCTCFKPQMIKSIVDMLQNNIWSIYFSTGDCFVTSDSPIIIEREISTKNCDFLSLNLPSTNITFPLTSRILVRIWNREYYKQLEPFNRIVRFVNDEFVRVENLRQYVWARNQIVSSIDYSDFYQKLKNEKGKEVFCKH